MRPAPAKGPGFNRSPGDPVYDRFWARVAEAGVIVGIHAADTPYGSYLEAWGEGGRWHGHKVTPLAEILGIHTDRTIYDMMAALIAHGVAPITRPFKAFEIGCVAAGGLAVWLGRRRRDAAPMAVAWLVALQVLVVTLGPYKAGRDPYRHWDLAQVIYAIGFAALAIGQAVAWRRLRPSKAGSPPVDS